VSNDPLGYQSEARATQRPAAPKPRDAQPRQAAPPTTGERLTRKRRTTDVFYVDPRIIPQHMSYEWKRESVFGQPDSENMIQARENHWRPVPAARHPELAAVGESTIRRGGSVLCERPKYLTDEAMLENIHEGMRPVQAKEELMYGSKPDEFTRDHPSVRKVASINQQYSPGPPINAPDDGGGIEP
jgi:hypothetical protein